jgi:hypothetical protein
MGAYISQVRYMHINHNAFAFNIDRSVFHYQLLGSVFFKPYFLF